MPVSPQRISRVLVVAFLAIMVLGGVVASVIVSPEFAAGQEAIRKGAALPEPPLVARQAVIAAREVTARRTAAIALLQLFHSSDALLRGTMATVEMGSVNGRPVVGFHDAARAYFGKDLSSLTLPEHATLAGRIASPPLSRDAVLARMLQKGFITRPEYERYTSTGT